METTLIIVFTIILTVIIMYFIPTGSLFDIFKTKDTSEVFVISQVPLDKEYNFDNQEERVEFVNDINSKYKTSLRLATKFELLQAFKDGIEFDTPAYVSDRLIPMYVNQSWESDNIPGVKEVPVSNAELLVYGVKPAARTDISNYVKPFNSDKYSKWTIVKKNLF